MLKAQGRKNGLRYVGKCVGVGDRGFGYTAAPSRESGLDGTARMNFQS